MELSSYIDSFGISGLWCKINSIYIYIYIYI